MMGKYDDIINLEVPTSKNHPRMSSNNRAAQFAPFAALVGYEEAIKESKEKADERKVLSEDKKEEIEGLLHKIISDMSLYCNIEVTYYSQDKETGKGKYVVYQGKVKRIDTSERKIIFANKKVVFIKDIYNLVLLENEREAENL